VRRKDEKDERGMQEKMENKRRGEKIRKQ